MTGVTVSNVRKRFGATEVLRGVTLEIQPGQITGLIGPNGAGKTTVLNAIAGEARADGGSIYIDGTESTRWRPERVARSGVVRAFQVPQLFDAMGVFQNLLVAAPAAWSERPASAFWPRRSAKLERDRARERANMILNLVGLTDVRRRRAGELSGGQRKLLELGKVLMTQPKLLLLDEPAAGIHPGLVGEISRVLVELRGEGVASFVVEHQMEFIFGISDVIHVLADGAVLASGSPDAVRRDKGVIAAYLGNA